MKIKLVMMLITLGVLVVVPLIMMGKFDPLAIFDSGFSKGADELSRLKAKAPNLANVVTDEKVQVYKWRDKNGVMQFSNVAPPSDRNAKRVVFDPNSNLMQAVKVPTKELEKETPKDGAQTELTNPYSVKGAKKIMDKARGVEKLLQQRQDQQQEMLNNL